MVIRAASSCWLRGPSLVGVAVIVLWVLVALTVPLWSPYDPLAEVGARLQGPSFSHLMGTDQLGRDISSPVMQAISAQFQTFADNPLFLTTSEVGA